MKKSDNLDYLNSKFGLLAMNIQSKIGFIAKRNTSVQLENIGIDAMNAVKCVCNYYRQHGFDLDESVTKDIVIYYYLYNRVSKANYFLSRYIDESKNNQKSVLYGISSFTMPGGNSKSLKKYQKIQDEVFYFELERDIVSIIEHYLDNYPKKDELYRKNVNKWISLYNSELEQLGIAERISHRYFNENGEEKEVIQKVKDY